MSVKESLSKQLPVLLACAAVLCLAAGCGGDSPGDTVPRESTRSEQRSTPTATPAVMEMPTATATPAAWGNGPRQDFGHEPDREALAALYKAANGSYWRNKANWLTNKPIGKWHGVTIDGSGRVTRLELNENGLTGRMPAELGGLDNLRSLELSWNRLTGPIPPELGRLGNLTALYLHGNGLTGPIPAELGKLGKLITLSLFANRLTGPIPAELGSIASLERLLLDSNGLSGPIPAELGGLGNLTVLSLNGNLLSGQIPTQMLVNMPNLTWLSLGGNELRGCVPDALRDQLTGAMGHTRGLPFCDEVPPPRPCAAGMKLKPREYCTIHTLPPDSEWHPAWPYQFEIKGRYACLGFVCSHDRIDEEKFSASRNSDFYGSWTVHRAP